jgi:hypothetical protein
MVYQEDITRFSVDFKNILLDINKISNKKDKITEKLIHLKTQYSEMIKTNTKKIFLFCLDSFFYQYKMYSTELDQIESSRKMVNNRMYCEYYKLYGIIVAYLGELNISYENKKEYLNKCPVYKDLEQFAEFDVVDVENIYGNVILLINHLNEQLAKNNIEIENYQVGDKVGFSISNFINTMKNNNLMLSGQIDLFMNYLEFFLSSQIKQYARICRRMKDLLMEMDESIEESFEKSNEKNMYKESYPSVSELSETYKNRELIIQDEIILEILPEKLKPKPNDSQKENESSPELEMSFE